VSNRRYVLGHSDTEIKRLMFQSEMLRPLTERLLHRAKLSAGMHVLDLGCDIGGLSQLAAQIVGPEGHVTAIDQSTKAIEIAKSLAVEKGLKNIQFVVSSVESFHHDQQFDMVVGRYVLLFQDDVILFLRKAAQLVKPEGRLALHEVDDGRQFQSMPKVELWDLAVQEILKRFKQGCPQYDIAQKMVHTFVSAGLPVPEVSYEIPVKGAPASDLCTWAAETLRMSCT
jgi:ubiquinone/menaquinone biosynthesis C-methylase UbiE